MNFASIVLAAGMATRFGGDKLSAPFRGEPLIHHAIRAARAAPVDRVIVVAGPQLDPGSWPGAPQVRIVRMTSDALSASLNAGIAAAGDADAAFIFLGDMPLIPHGVAGNLAAALGNHIAAVPTVNGKRGHPVLLSRAAFPAVTALTGDEGAGRFLRSCGDVVLREVGDPAILIDIDRREDIARLDRPGKDTDD